MPKSLTRLAKKILVAGLVVCVALIIYILNAWKFSLSEQDVHGLVTEITQSEELPDRLYEIYNLEYNNSLDKNLIQTQFILTKPINPPSLMVSRFYLFDNGKRYHKNHLLTAHSLSLKLENSTTQRQCLNWVIKQTDFGYGSTGMDSAAKYFFEKELYKLNDRELATLVIMLKNTSLYNPIRRKKLVDTKVDGLMEKITMANKT